MSLVLLGSLLVALPQQAPQSRPRPVREPQPFLYYDYVEDGELRGGRVAVDPANPLHVALEPELRGGLGDPVTTLLDNGPSENRIDIVIVGDGYTSAQLGTYASDVDDVWPEFLSEHPLSVYATFFNVHRVDVASPQSGVDNDPTQGIQRDTALDMGYWCGGTQRLLCVNVSKARQRANAARDVDSILALANSGTYGGAGYSDLGTLAGHNGATIEIALHEFGHSFANLADEYDYGGPQVYTGNEPGNANVSIHDEAELVSLSAKWYRWLDLPEVGAFEGAMYSQQGIYRPTNNSKMRSLDRPFQAVNNERLVRNIYGFVHPIDAATPPGSYPVDADFFVDPVDPVGHALDVQWSLDGSPIPGATATTFDAATLGLGTASGTHHELSVTVVDNTTLVRNPTIRDNWLTETRSWTLRGKPRAHLADEPTASVDVAELVLGGSPRPGGTIVLELALDPTSEPRLAVLFVTPSTSTTSAGRPTTVAALAREDGAPLRFEIAVPDDPALAERAFRARAVIVDGAGRRTWSEPLEVAIEP